MNKLRDLVDPSFRIQKWKCQHHGHTAEDFLGVTGHFNPGFLNPNLEPQASTPEFPTPWHFNHEIFNNELFNPLWLKSPGLKNS